MKDASKELKDKFNEEITTLENETIDLEDDTLVVPEYFSDDDTKGGESSEEEEEEFGDDHVTKVSEVECCWDKEGQSKNTVWSVQIMHVLPSWETTITNVDLSVVSSSPFY